MAQEDSYWTPVPEGSDYSGPVTAHVVAHNPDKSLYIVEVRPSSGDVGIPTPSFVVAATTLPGVSIPETGPTPSPMSAPK